MTKAKPSPGPEIRHQAVDFEVSTRFQGDSICLAPGPVANGPPLTNCPDCISRAPEVWLRGMIETMLRPENIDAADVPDSVKDALRQAAMKLQEEDWITCPRCQGPDAPFQGPDCTLCNGHRKVTFTVAKEYVGQYADFSGIWHPKPATLQD